MSPVLSTFVMDRVAKKLERERVRRNCVSTSELLRLILNEYFEKQEQEEHEQTATPRPVVATTTNSSEVRA